MEEPKEIEITPREYNELIEMQQKILNMLASRGNYKFILESLCILAEKLLPNSVASIMLLDKETKLMSVLSAPSIPPEGQDALKNLRPGPGGGSCGNAVFRNEPQYVLNTFKDHRWEDLRKVAFDYNLRSCWSMPIRDEDNKILGTFALSSFEHRSPAPFHKKLLETAASLVNIILKNQRNEQKIEQMAFHDSLTGLYNKTYLERLLLEDKNKTLILLNVNNFSYINFAYGFEFGDKLLKKLANILKNKFFTQAICRVDSDEFALLFEKEIDIAKMVEDIQKYFFSQEIDIDNIKLNISFSYGAAYGNTNILRNSAIALKQAKVNGKNNLYVYDENNNSIGNIDNTQRKSFIAMNNILHNALAEDRVVPYFQGIRNNTTKQITKFESLVRIVDGDKVISPYSFLQIAKLSGLLTEITKVMVKKTFQIMSDIEYIFSLNITEDDLNQNYLNDYLQEQALLYGINPHRVIIEILEGLSANGKKNHIKQLRKLKSHGYSLAIDDFGTEYSNFERVLDLDIDFLKIDAKYIKDIHTNKKSFEITKAILFFAKNSGIPCIAEFVHNFEVQSIVEELGVDYSQGYYFSEPTDRPIAQL